MHQRRAQIRIIALIMMFFLLIFSSGCIHIDFGDPFKSEEPEPTKYHIIQKDGFPFSYKFDTIEKRKIENNEAKPIIVKKGTEWVNISIKVVINEFNFINDSPIANYTSLERYVQVVIVNPDNEEYYRKKFIESDEVKRQLSTPATGRWGVKVNAVGLGYQGTHDSYLIDALANEPM